MKDKLISFPTDEVRDWVEVERTLRATLDNHGARDDIQTSIISSMKAYWQRLNESNLKISFPKESNLNAFFDPGRETSTRILALNEEIQARNQSLKHKLILEKLIQEIEAHIENGMFYPENEGSLTPEHLFITQPSNDLSNPKYAISLVVSTLSKSKCKLLSHFSL